MAQLVTESIDAVKGSTILKARERVGVANMKEDTEINDIYQEQEVERYHNNQKVDN